MIELKQCTFCYGYYHGKHTRNQFLLQTKYNSHHQVSIFPTQNVCLPMPSLLFQPHISCLQFHCRQRHLEPILLHSVQSKIVLYFQSPNILLLLTFLHFQVWNKGILLIIWFFFCFLFIGCIWNQLPFVVMCTIYVFFVYVFVHIYSIFLFCCLVVECKPVLNTLVKKI